MNAKSYLRLVSCVALTALAFGGCSSSQKRSDESAERVETSEQTSTSQTDSSDMGSPVASTESAGQTTSDSESGTDISSQASRLPLTDVMVLNKMHHLNTKEIQMSELARNKAESPQVKRMAEEVMNDHQALETRVQEVASSHGVKLQGYQQATYEKATWDRLNALSGAEFDTAFTQLMRQGHREAVQDLRQANTMVSDRQIKSLITEAIPKLRQHRQISSQSPHSSKGGEMEESSEMYHDKSRNPSSVEEPVSPSTDQQLDSGMENDQQQE